MKIDWKRKLSSRKFWLAVAEFVTPTLLAFGVTQNTVTQVVSIIMAGGGVIAYIISEGLTDAASIKSSNDNSKSE